MTTPRRIHDLVLDLLRTVGPMTRLELEALVPATPRHVGTVLFDLQGKAPPVRHGYANRGPLPRQVRIVEWRRDNADGASREYLRAVYGPGVQPDAPRPPLPTDAERLRRQRARRSAPRKTARTVGNSVFTWRPQA